MIELLLHAAPHNYSGELNRAESPLLPRYVRRARDYIADHLAEIRSVAEIATAIGVSPRTLQNGFKQTLNASPAEYVRQARVRQLPVDDMQVGAADAAGMDADQDLARARVAGRALHGSQGGARPRPVQLHREHGHRHLAERAGTSPAMVPSL